MTRVECVEHRRQHYHDGSHRGERELRDIFTKFPAILLTVARSYAPCSERSAGLSFGRQEPAPLARLYAQNLPML